MSQQHYPVQGVQIVEKGEKNRATGTENSKRKRRGKMDGQAREPSPPSPQSPRVFSVAFPSSRLSPLSERLEQATTTSILVPWNSYAVKACLSRARPRINANATTNANVWKVAGLPLEQILRRSSRDLFLSKWFEPRSISSLSRVIARVSVVLKRTSTVGDSD